MSSKLLRDPHDPFAWQQPGVEVGVFCGSCSPFAYGKIVSVEAWGWNAGQDFQQRYVRVLPEDTGEEFTALAADGFPVDMARVMDARQRLEEP